MCFEMHGLEHEVRSAVNMIMDVDIVKAGLLCSLMVIALDLKSTLNSNFITRFASKLSWQTNIASLLVERKMAK
jgi:hypothetical protein